MKIDPKLVKAARELRDRYLEQINSGLLLAQGKYDVSRALEAPRVNVHVNPAHLKRLPEAA